LKNGAKLRCEEQKNYDECYAGDPPGLLTEIYAVACESSLPFPLMPDEILHNWEKKSADHHKQYRQFLQKADKNKVLKQLPDLHEEAVSKIDCVQCANCCKNYSPRFKTPDIKRISKHLKLRESEFIDKYLKVDEDGDFVVKSTPCPFLGGDNLCGIYEHRPSDCHRFPYTDEDVFLKRPHLTLKNASFCPISYYVLEKLLVNEKR
jgi:Fe-S-cluster containining protein